MSSQFTIAQGTFAGQDIRITPDHYASIYDVIRVASGVKNPHDTWNTVHTRFTGDFKIHKFPGRGQQNTPVVNHEHIDNLVALLPGHRVRKTLYEQKYGVNANDTNSTLGVKKIEKSCHLYVRILGDTNVIKFGMSTDLRSRHHHLRNDKGRFYGTILMDSEKDAKHVESIFCALLKRISVDESHEYIDVTEFCHMAHLAEDTTYEEAAQYLLGMVVKMAHSLYPDTISEKVRIYNSKDYNRFIQIDADSLSGYHTLSLF